MNTVKILHAADCHIGSSRSYLSEKSSFEIKNTFYKIINMCKTESIDFLLIAGDLFETPFPSADDVADVIHMFSQIPDTIIAIVSGNHDYACLGSVYLKHNFPENVRIFTSFVEYFDFPEKNVRLWGAGFTDRFENLSLLSATNDLPADMINICIMHGELLGDLSESCYNPISVKQIENCGFDYLALGHIHKRTEILKSGNTYYSYCGCPDGKGFDEDGSKGIYIGELGKGSCQLEYRELSSRKYIFERFDVSSLSSSIQIAEKILEFLKDKYSDSFGDNLYRLTLFGCVDSDVIINLNSIKAFLADYLSYCDVFDETELDFNSICSFADETSLKGIFVKKMLSKLENASDIEAENIQNALKLGLLAFEREVKLNDN